MFRCSRCPSCRPIVHPCGPIPARVLFIAECPNREEDQQGEPLVGKTGREFSHVYLPILGLPKSAVHITNATLCSRKTYDNPTVQDAESCLGLHLGDLLEQVKPEIVVPMGVIACSQFGSINLAVDHGIPRPGKWGPHEFVLFPMFHPSAGMKPGAYMIPLMDDFNELRKLMKELDGIR